MNITYYFRVEDKIPGVTKADGSPIIQDVFIATGYFLLDFMQAAFLNKHNWDKGRISKCWVNINGEEFLVDDPDDQKREAILDRINEIILYQEKISGKG
jgi:hypothetical protein